MHSAHLSKSERLQRVAELLGDGRPRTTLDIIKGANVCAVSAVVSELRTQGLIITCQRVGDVWWYQRVMREEGAA